MEFQKVSLNCDMGESFGIWQMGCDEEVMPWIDLANIACGFHASDPSVMSDTVQLAIQHRVKIGAHPGYPDLQGFGRRSVKCSTEEITQLVTYQVGALDAICRLHGAQVKYIKPHGALYNDMMKDPSIFHAIVKVARLFSVPLMILASSDNSAYLEMADKYNVPLLFEAFADRSYLDNGLLAPRNHPRAVYKNSDDIFHQVMQIAKYSSVNTVSGQKIQIQADTVCIHGDNEHSIAAIRKIKEALMTL